jgi:uncharacterized protein (DUF169 family)
LSTACRVKFLLTKPDGLERLDKKAAFCQMLKEAQEGRPFYTTKEDTSAGRRGFLGMDRPIGF